MGQKLPYTPNSRIKHALRLLWMRSRERGQALRNTGYTCAYCGKKQSTAKGKECQLDVHHLDGIDWDGVIDIVRKRILQTPDRLAPACPECHDKIPQIQKKEVKMDGAITPEPQVRPEAR